MSISPSRGAAWLAAACSAADAPVWLCAWERNDRALSFHARHGFAPVGEIKVHVRDVAFDDLVLVRRPALLDEGRRTEDE